jgi:hypothetical protein
LEITEKNALVAIKDSVVLKRVNDAAETVCVLWDILVATELSLFFLHVGANEGRGKKGRPHQIAGIFNKVHVFTKLYSIKREWRGWGRDGANECSICVASDVWEVVSIAQG